MVLLDHGVQLRARCSSHHDDAIAKEEVAQQIWKLALAENWWGSYDIRELTYDDNDRLTHIDGQSLEDLVRECILGDDEKDDEGHDMEWHVAKWREEWE
jgi:hypothetical protein